MLNTNYYKKQKKQWPKLTTAFDVENMGFEPMTS